jgi:rhodanese-related sulfurtransferase
MDIMQYNERLEAVSLKELMLRMEKGEVLLIDVRPKEEYDTDHISGAISIPIEELEKHLSGVSLSINIIKYRTSGK